MNPKEMNSDIRCTVKSCEYNMQDKDYCTLSAIHVDARMNGGTGKPEDECMCGSYQCK